MDSINAKSYHSPTTFKGEITLPPARPREHVDPTTTVLLQNASGVAMSDLPAPQQIVFNSGVQSRLEKLASGYLPSVRKVLAEADAMQDEVMQRRREREAQAQNNAWVHGYQATIENDKASGLQRDGKFVQAGAQAVSGAFEAGTAGKGLNDKRKAGDFGRKAVDNEKAAAREKGFEKTERREAAQLENRIETLEKSRNGHPAHDARIDQELADTRTELAQKYETIDAHAKAAQDHTRSANKAHKTEHLLERDDTELALAKGTSALLNSAAGFASAQLDHEGELEKNKAQRLQLLRDQEEGAGRRAGSGADENQAARSKLLDFGAEVTRLERPADLA